MQLPHCVVIFDYLPWFGSIKVINKKLQPNAENACGNRICKRAFTPGEIYRVCHGFRLMKRDDYFHVKFDHLFFEAAGVVVKIGWSLKPNHYKEF